MSRRRKYEKKTYQYECSLTGESYTLTEKVGNPDELISVKAYYELNPEKDDRPLVVKKRLGIAEEQQALDKASETGEEETSH